MLFLSVALREYVVDQQKIMSTREFKEYVVEVGLEEKLMNDQKMLELAPDKLKKALDK